MIQLTKTHLWDLMITIKVRSYLRMFHSKSVYMFQSGINLKSVNTINKL